MAKKTTKPRMKKVPGKSSKTAASAPVYKPSIYLDNKQIPKELNSAKPGQTVTVTAKAKVTRKSEGTGGERSVSVELDKISVSPGKGK